MGWLTGLARFLRGEEQSSDADLTKPTTLANHADKFSDQTADLWRERSEFLERLNEGILPTHNLAMFDERVSDLSVLKEEFQIRTQGAWRIAKSNNLLFYWVAGHYSNHALPTSERVLPGGSILRNWDGTQALPAFPKDIDDLKYRGGGVFAITTQFLYFAETKVEPEDDFEIPGNRWAIRLPFRSIDSAEGVEISGKPALEVIRGESARLYFFFSSDEMFGAGTNYFAADIIKRIKARGEDARWSR